MEQDLVQVKKTDTIRKEKAGNGAMANAEQIMKERRVVSDSGARTRSRIAPVAQPGRSANVGTRKIMNDAVYKQDSKKIKEYPIGDYYKNQQWSSKKDEVKQSIGADVNASASYGVVEVSGGASFNSNTKNVGMEKTFVLYAHNKIYEVNYERPDSSDLEPGPFKIRDNYPLFYERYGSGFVKQAIYGGKVIGIITLRFSSASSIDKFNFHVGGGASGGVMSAEARTSISMDESMKNEQVEIGYQLNLVGKFHNPGGSGQGSGEAGQPKLEKTVFQEAMEVFKKAEEEVIARANELQNMKKEDAALIFWSLDEHPEEVFEAVKPIVISKNMVDKINQFQTEITGRIFLLACLNSVTRTVIKGDNKSLILAYDEIEQISNSDKQTTIIKQLNLDILSCLYAKTDDDAEKNLDKLKKELGYIKEEERAPSVYDINEKPLVYVLDYIEHIRQNYWINTIGPNVNASISKPAVGMLTPIGNIDGKNPLTYDYADASWRSMSLDEAYKKVNHKGGIWIGYGEKNPGARFKAPWCLQVLPNDKEPGFATPIYAKGYNEILTSTDNGLVCESMQDDNLEIRDYEHNSEANLLIAATTKATVSTNANGCFEVRSNNGDYWRYDTPGNDVANKAPIFKGKEVAFNDRLFTNRGNDGYGNPQGPIDQYAGYMSGPKDDYQGFGFENGTVFFFDTYCNAKIHSMMAWRECDGIICRVKALKRDANSDNDVQRFLQLSAIWDKYGRMTL